MCRVKITFASVNGRGTRAEMTLDLEASPPSILQSLLGFEPYMETIVAEQGYDNTLKLSFAAELDGRPTAGELPMVVFDNLKADLRKMWRMEARN